mmetsp:Transcript_23709/g.23470  ORF Transcript_23709/g.23470 Transcript_23709/m.23470 type:complete len:211 (-) Transcript_23709:111-743(-)
MIVVQIDNLKGKPNLSFNDVPGGQKGCLRNLIGCLSGGESGIYLISDGFGELRCALRSKYWSTRSANLGIANMANSTRAISLAEITTDFWSATDRLYSMLIFLILITAFLAADLKFGISSNSTSCFSKAVTNVISLLNSICIGPHKCVTAASLKGSHRAARRKPYNVLVIRKIHNRRSPSVTLARTVLRAFTSDRRCSSNSRLWRSPSNM